MANGLLTDKLAAAEDDEEPHPDGPSKVNKTPEKLDQIGSTIDMLFSLQILHGEAGCVFPVSWNSNEVPNDPSDGEESRSEEEAVVVSELGNRGGGSNSGSGACDLVEDVLKGTSQRMSP